MSTHRNQILGGYVNDDLTRSKLSLKNVTRWNATHNRDRQICVTIVGNVMGDVCHETLETGLEQVRNIIHIIDLGR